MDAHFEQPPRVPRPMPLRFEVEEWIPDWAPRPGGIRFARGIFLGVALCLPIWLLGLLAIIAKF